MMDQVKLGYVNIKPNERKMDLSKFIETDHVQNVIWNKILTQQKMDIISNSIIKLYYEEHPKKKFWHNILTKFGLQHLW